LELNESDVSDAKLVFEENVVLAAVVVAVPLVFDENKKLDEKLGTPYYIAPEVLNKNYGAKCDIWSCGVITYITLSGIPPFNGASDQEIMKKVKSGKFSFADPVWATISD